MCSERGTRGSWGGYVSVLKEVRHGVGLDDVYVPRVNY